MLARWVQEHAPTHDIERGLNNAAAIAASLQDDATSAGQRQILQTIFLSITLAQDTIRFVVRKQTLVQHLLAATNRKPVDGQASNTDSADRPEDETVVIDRAIAIKRRGVEARIVIDGPAGREPEQSLIDLIARAHFYLARLCDGSVTSIAGLAHELAVHPADISRILPLAFLSPAMTDAILAGRQPADLTARNLARLVDIPPDWRDQAEVMGV